MHYSVRIKMLTMFSSSQSLKQAYVFIEWKYFVRCEAYGSVNSFLSWCLVEKGWRGTHLPHKLWHQMADRYKNFRDGSLQVNSSAQVRCKNHFGFEITLYDRPKKG